MKRCSTSLGNANHNHKKPVLYPLKMSKKKKSITNVGEDAEKEEPLYTASGNVN